jgi:hypothetical protein
MPGDPAFTMRCLFSPRMDCARTVGKGGTGAFADFTLDRISSACGGFWATIEDDHRIRDLKCLSTRNAQCSGR